jgi:hypothetical protein
MQFIKSFKCLGFFTPYRYCMNIVSVWHNVE